MGKAHSKHLAEWHGRGTACYASNDLKSVTNTISYVLHHTFQGLKNLGHEAEPLHLNIICSQVKASSDTPVPIPNVYLHSCI